MIINNDELLKRNGQSLNAKKEFLKPVSNETTDRIFSIPKTPQYTTDETVPVLSTIVTIAARIPINIRLTPSIIHSTA